MGILSDFLVYLMELGLYYVEICLFPFIIFDVLRIDGTEEYRKLYIFFPKMNAFLFIIKLIGP